MKKKKSKFGRMRKEARLLKTTRDFRKEQRRTVITAKEWERYCEQKNITGKLKKMIIQLSRSIPQDRKNAVFSLSVMKDPRAFEPMVFMLRDREHEVVSEVIKYLGHVGREKAVKPLSEMLLHSENHNHRFRAADALANLKVKQVVTPFLEALKKIDQDPKFKTKIISNLGKIPDQRSVKPLVEFIKGENLEHANTAAKSLRELTAAGIKAEGLEKPLIDLLKNPENKVKVFAARALTELDSRKGLQAMLSVYPHMHTDQRNAMAPSFYTFAFKLAKGKNLEKLVFANNFLRLDQTLNPAGRMLLFAFAVNPKMCDKLPLNKDDARHKLDYLISLREDMERRALIDIYHAFKLDKVKIK
jgi:hypothetical protein